VRPSPARAQPHDTNSWLPLPDVDLLPELDDHITTAPDTAEARSAPLDVAAPPPSPARARPHDAAAWLPLPTERDLPGVEELITEAPWEARPSPARAEPHDAAAWLPLPTEDDLPPGPTAQLSDAPVKRRSRIRARTWAAGVAALVVITVVSSAFVLSQVLDGGNRVDLRVDGRRLSVETGAATVGELLRDRRVRVGPFDRVVPARTDALRDGLTVSVLRAFPITRDLDGDVQTVYTAFASPQDYVKNDLEASDRVVIRSGPQRLQSDSTIILRTRHSGTLVVDGQTVPYDIPALDVDELLAQYSIELGPEDYVLLGTGAVKRDTRLIDGNKFEVIRVGRALEHAEEQYTLADERRPDPNMNVGETRVEPGAGGVMSVTYELVHRNGTEVSRKAVSRVPVVAARPTITHYGTRADPMWDRIAACETGSNWGMQGPLYSGGLGFYNGTWDGWGGREFASNAGLASREQQIVVAERVRRDVGISGWGCARTLGYVR
jgi:uncharacterized protein YabE (DUF348 family)